jgi:hypothetical protein
MQCNLHLPSAGGGSLRSHTTPVNRSSLAHPSHHIPHSIAHSSARRLEAQDAWARAQVAADADSSGSGPDIMNAQQQQQQPLTQLGATGLLLAQFDGLVEGYAAAAVAAGEGEGGAACDGRAGPGSGAGSGAGSSSSPASASASSPGQPGTPCPLRRVDHMFMQVRGGAGRGSAL